ncbi:hypothetical protein QTA57_10995 [Fontisubflavum oceani]|uniref:hypothetical protein n=1 Tax=Fontisubflavum oceani TaxID=2978973 RepID=UPI0025B518CC|nr:hypothetical protein [Fontisubflavum oceani]WJY20392.1 hypothetical protein QTA57_10995 [Fontisubflavum oceani]
MDNSSTGRPRQTGYALIVVLGMLAIVTVIFSISTAGIVSQSRFLADERYLNMNRNLHSDLLHVAAQAKTMNANLEGLNLTLNNQNIQISFQDVAGLIDINTAHPDLVERLLGRLAVDADNSQVATENFRALRSQGARIERLEDFVALTMLQQRTEINLAAVATVYSGQAGINPTVAPPAVLEVASNSGETPDEFVDSRLTEVFRVLLSVDGAPARGIGTVFADRTAQNSRILDVE